MLPAGNHLQEVANMGRENTLPPGGGGCYFGTLGLFHQNGTHSVSMVASGSSKIGIPLRMGYTRLHSLHFRASSPRNTRGFRHTGQASISSRSGLIMVGDFSRTPPLSVPRGLPPAREEHGMSQQSRFPAKLPAAFVGLPCHPARAKAPGPQFRRLSMRGRPARDVPQLPHLAGRATPASAPHRRTGGV